jgi:5-methyltetrahydropteroyltriglutamate--homocysteine methyltransferase
MFSATKDKAVLTTTTGTRPRPNWYTENQRGAPLSQEFLQHACREQLSDSCGTSV